MRHRSAQVVGGVVEGARVGHVGVPAVRLLRQDVQSEVVTEEVMVRDIRIRLMDVLWFFFLSVIPVATVIVVAVAVLMEKGRGILETSIDFISLLSWYLAVVIPAAVGLVVIKVLELR